MYVQGQRALAEQEMRLAELAERVATGTESLSELQFAEQIVERLRELMKERRKYIDATAE